jgi:hypothetical protein
VPDDTRSEEKMMKTRSQVPIVLSTLGLLLVGCGDGALTPEIPTPEIDPVLAGAASAAIHDAVQRVLPALRPGGSTGALDSSLLQLFTALETKNLVGVDREILAVRSALDAYEQSADAEFAPDVAAIRLVLSTLRDP